MMIGVGYRAPLAGWLKLKPAAVDCLEITAEHFYDGGLETVRAFRRQYPLFVHGLGLSLGTRGPLDHEQLRRFRQVVDAADPQWISEHVAFTRTSEVDLGHLNPIARTRSSLETIASHARELADFCQRPLILENITSHLRLAGEISETDFLNELCRKAECGMLLDVTNLYINSRNHRFDPLDWLGNLELRHVVQMHVVGYSIRDGVYEDGHSEFVQDELVSLLKEVSCRSDTRAVILERDHAFPPVSQIEAELACIRGAAGGDCLPTGSGSPVARRRLALQVS